MTFVGTPRAAQTPRLVVRVALAAVLLAGLLGVVGPAAHPAPVDAESTASYMEGLLLKWINNARADRGVPALRTTDRLMDLAGDRAADMASKGRIDHLECLSCTLRSRGVSFSRCAEVVAWTSYPWGYDAARSIFNGWKSSSSHWGILMSRSYGRIGLGVAYRSSSSTTYAAGILVGG